MAKVDLQTAVMSVLKDYQGDVLLVTRTVIPKLAQEARRQLKTSSPRRPGSHRHYYTQWSYQNSKSRIGISSVVYNKAPTYRLTHLLEYGHATRNGGRTKAYPHIQKVNDWVQDQGVKTLEAALEAIK